MDRLLTNFARIVHRGGWAHLGSVDRDSLSIPPHLNEALLIFWSLTVFEPPAVNLVMEQLLNNRSEELPCFLPYSPVPNLRKNRALLLPPPPAAARRAFHFTYFNGVNDPIAETHCVQQLLRGICANYKSVLDGVMLTLNLFLQHDRRLFTR